MDIHISRKQEVEVIQKYTEIYKNIQKYTKIIIQWALKSSEEGQSRRNMTLPAVII